MAPCLHVPASDEDDASFNATLLVEDTIDEGSDSQETRSIPQPSRASFFKVLFRKIFGRAHARRSHVFRRWPRRRSLYVLVVTVILLLWVAIIIVFAEEQFHESLENYGKDLASYSRFKGDYWFLRGRLIQLDIEKRRLNIQWSATYRDTDGSIFPGSMILDATDFPEGLNVYTDISTIVDINVTSFWDDGYVYYKLDNDTAEPIGNVGRRQTDHFDTEIVLQGSNNPLWFSTLQAYPWDWWFGTTVVASNNIGSSKKDLNRTDGYVISFDGVSLVDDILNWQIKEYSFSTCQENYALADGCELHIEFFIHRSTVVVFIVIAVILVNWLSTICILLITLEALLLHRMHIVGTTDIVAVSFAALFALPGVRSLLPGAPPFGSTIDMIGILPNVIIISLCASCWACAKLRGKLSKRPDEVVRPVVCETCNARVS